MGCRFEPYLWSQFFLRVTDIPEVAGKFAPRRFVSLTKLPESFGHARNIYRLRINWFNLPAFLKRWKSGNIRPATAWLECRPKVISQKSCSPEFGPLPGLTYLSRSCWSARLEEQTSRWSCRSGRARLRQIMAPSVRSAFGRLRKLRRKMPSGLRTSKARQ